MPFAAEHPPKLVRFAGFELDALTGELRRGSSCVRLQPQPLKLLMALLRHPGELVTREELKQGLMPDAACGDFDHAINLAVSKLRVALDDPADSPHLIETLPRRGYRFVGDIDPGGESAERMRLWTGGRVISRLPVLRNGWVGIVTALGVVTLVAVFLLMSMSTHPPSGGNEIHSLAVLPLTNLSHDPGQEYFADGMTDALITEISQTSSLKVISRTSVMRYKGASKGAPEIAKELNVDGIVEGSVLRTGDRVRISAQLINARSDTHMWAKSYDRDLRDVLSLQSEVALSIGAA